MTTIDRHDRSSGRPWWSQRPTVGLVSNDTDGAAPPRTDEAERSGRAWAAFCDELRSTGERILDDGEHLDDQQVAEGSRHLSRLLRLALELELEYGDPAHPRFVCHERPSAQWGGPNPDNYYLRAAIDPTSSYRMWADVGGVEDVILSLMEGDMALEQYGVYSEVSLSDLDVRGGRLELVVAPERTDGNWMPMHPSATNLTVRIFQSDPVADAAPYVHIERLDSDPTAPVAPPRFDAGDLESALQQTARWVDASVGFWQRYMERFAASPARNTLSEPSHPPGGAEHILYGGGMWRLEPDEALLVECDLPDARYWNFTIHTYPWFESGDHERRCTSRNHRDVHVDQDGRVRLVVAHADPGVPNWIDTEDRRESVLTYRYIHADSAPHPQARVVALGSIRDELPDDHPTTTPEQRRAELARRAEALRERYR